MLSQSLLLFFFYILILKQPPPTLLTSSHMGLTPSLKRYISQSIWGQDLLVSSFVGLRNWNISQNSFTYVNVATSCKLDEYYSAFILSISCTQRVKLLDNLKFDIYNYNWRPLAYIIDSLHIFSRKVYFLIEREAFLIIINMIANSLSKFLYSSNSRLFLFAGQGTQ